MKTNEELQRDVQNAIKWEPLLNAAEIGVTVKDGIVTLSGTVDSYAKKLEAENAAKGVIGVKAVAIDIEVNYGGTFAKNDTEIAQEVLNAWRWNMNVPEDKIQAKVESGWVTLTGEVNWFYQKEAARKAVVTLAGVKGVINNINIKESAMEHIEKQAVKRNLQRNRALRDDEIHVDVTGHRIKLTGEVESLYEKEEAERMALKASGVWSVDNQLIVNYDY